MKYLSSPKLSTINRALNFTTSDTIVEGACDLYTTKASKNDKKVYQEVDETIVSNHSSLLRLTASLSPPRSDMTKGELAQLDLSQSSPFGSLTEPANRRTFAYLVATLNASHADYDFTGLLKPSDFVREKSIKNVTTEIDETLYNVRPRTISSLLAARNSSVSGQQTPGGTPTWSGKMWSTIDDEITLSDCEIYRFQPDEDFLEDDELALWTTHVFFFNRKKKRVAYIHLRGLSILSHSPPSMYLKLDSRSSRNSKRDRPVSRTIDYAEPGASKRAKYWLGNKTEFIEADGPETIDDLEDVYWGVDGFDDSENDDDALESDHVETDYDDDDDDLATSYRDPDSPEATLHTIEV